MLSEPMGNEVVASVATPAVSVPVPSVVVPSSNVTVPVGEVVFPDGPVTVAVKVTLCPAVIDVGDAESEVEDAAGPVTAAPYSLSKIVLPTRMSGIVPPLRLAATAGPDSSRFSRSFGMIFGAEVVPMLTEVNVPSPLP